MFTNRKKCSIIEKIIKSITPKGSDKVKKNTTLKRYISAAAAALLIALYAAVPVYAESGENVTVREDSEDEAPSDSMVVPVIQDDTDAPETTSADTTQSPEDEPDAPDTTAPPVTTEDPEGEPDETGDEPEVTEPLDVTTSAPAELVTNPPPATTAAPATTTAAPSTTAAAGTPSYTEVSPYRVIARETVNIRSGPGTGYARLGSAVGATEYTVVGKSGDWLVISYGGSVGYVLGEYFAETQGAADTTSAGQNAGGAGDTTTQPPEETAQTEDTSGWDDPWQEPISDTAQVTESPANLIDEPETTASAQSQPEETTQTTAAAGSTSADDNSSGGGIAGVLIALGCGIGTFLLVGVLPVVIHRIYHNKLYQY